MEKFIRDILYERKATAEKIAKEKLASALLIPTFDIHWKNEKKLRIQKAKSVALSLPFDQTQLTSEINFVDNLLLKKNMKREDLLPKYSCKVCSDTGLNNGKICDCVRKLKSELNLKKSNLKKFHSFSELNREFYDGAEQLKSVDFLIKWTLSPTRKKNNVTIFGGTGVGKTFLFECVANEFFNKNKNVLFTTAFKMNNDFYSAHIGKSDKVSIFSEYLEPDVLIIDDLGSEPIYNNITREYLYLVLNQRMIEEKITLISTNFTPLQIKEIYGERCFSRIMNKANCHSIYIENSDIRLKKF